MPDWLSLLVGGLTALTLALGLITGATRYVLLPWLREHLVNPVKQVEKQVSENHHANESPTVLDRISDVSAQVSALGRVLEGHMDASDEETKQLWRAITHILLQIKDPSHG